MELGRMCSSQICLNLPVYGGNWDRHSTSLWLSGPASSAPCDAELVEVCEVCDAVEWKVVNPQSSFFPPQELLPPPFL